MQTIMVLSAWVGTELGRLNGTFGMQFMVIRCDTLPAQFCHLDK